MGKKRDCLNALTTAQPQLSVAATILINAGKAPAWGEWAERCAELARATAELRDEIDINTQLPEQIAA